jgi:membrane-associated protein
MTMLGYELGSVPIVRKNFDKVILMIIFVSLIPSAIEVLRARLKPKADKVKAA